MAVSKEGKVCLGVYLDKDDHARLKDVAKSQDLTISQVVRKAIKEYLAKENKEA